MIAARLAQQNKNAPADPPPTVAEIAERRAAFQQSRIENGQAHAEAADIFEAYQNHDGGHDFIEYLENRPPPSPDVILYLIGIALDSDPPYKMNDLGRRKAAVLYGAAKKAALAEYKANSHSTNKKGKAKFASDLAKTLKTSAGKPIAASTIYRWLPTNKK